MHICGTMLNKTNLAFARCIFDALWHGCRLSVVVRLSVDVTNECIVAKRCEIGTRLLLITNRKFIASKKLTL